MYFQNKDASLRRQKVTNIFWSIHLRARIPASHAGHRGSNPLSTTQKKLFNTPLDSFFSHSQPYSPKVGEHVDTGTDVTIRLTPESSHQHTHSYSPHLSLPPKIWLKTFRAIPITIITLIINIAQHSYILYLHQQRYSAQLTTCVNSQLYICYSPQ